MIVFTDLDGTLLDHRSYDHRPALSAIEALKARSIPLILASSKTAAEIDPLLVALDLPGPAIVENGAGIHRRGDRVEGGGDHGAIREALDRIPATLRGHFTGFTDLGIDGIASKTGLSREAAALAASRRFSEPGLFSGDPAERAAFEDALRSEGLTCQQGGRFLTVSAGGTKAERMDEIIEAASAEAPVVALGDAPNDRAMLQRADIAIIVANPSNPPLAFEARENQRLIRTDEAGPSGWNRAILTLLDTRSAT